MAGEDHPDELTQSSHYEFLGGGDHTARRAMVENFGEMSPIPPATKNRILGYQEAARLYIHHQWRLERIAKVLGLSENYLSDVKNMDKWDDFAAEISATLKPSLWVQNDFEVLDQQLIKTEQDRRVAGIARLRFEEERIMSMMATLVPGSKPYNSSMVSLRAVRVLIDDATGVAYHRQENSHARKKIMNHKIDRGFMDVPKVPTIEHPGDTAKRVPGTVVDVFSVGS